MFGTLTILIIILAIVITSQNIEKGKIESKKSVLNTSTTEQSSPTPTSSPSPTESPTLTPTPTPTSFITTPQPNTNNQLNTDFYYPDSILTVHNSTETVYESTDDPKKITEWYKDKIKIMGMKATSFVQTTTNGNVLNKLVGANQNQEVRIEISKQNNNSLVKIVVVTN